MIRVQRQTFFLSKYLPATPFSLFTTSRMITAVTTVVPFYFLGQIWRVFTSSKIFFSVALSEALTQRCSLIKYETYIKRFSFKIAVLNIFLAIPRKTSVTELIFSIVMNFQYVLCCWWVSRNKLSITLFLSLPSKEVPTSTSFLPYVITPDSF